MALKSKSDLLDQLGNNLGASLSDASGPLQQGGGYFQYIFPNSLLADSNHFMMLRAVKRNFRQSAEYPTKDDLGRIVLPLPANLGAQYNHDYSAEGIGLSGELGSRMASQFRGVDSAKSAINAIVAGAKSMEGEVKDIAQYAGLATLEAAAPAIGAAAAGPLGFAAGTVGTNVLKGVTGQLGIARNPYMAMMYNNPSFREFQFEWKLVAKSLKESIILYHLIKKLKYHAAPAISSDNIHFFQYPDQWDIDFSDSSSSFEIGPSILKNIAIDYHAEGQPLYFRSDGSRSAGQSIAGNSNDYLQSDITYPASVKLTLTFQEVFIITKNEIEEQNR